MKIMTIGIILVIFGCSILGWLIKEAYKDNKDTSTKSKIFYLGKIVAPVELPMTNINM